MSRASLEIYTSVGGGAFFQRLLKEWEKGGRQVTLHHELGENDYRRQRGFAARWWLRWRMYGTYAHTCWRSALRSRSREPLRVVTTNPFFAPALIEWTAKGRGRTINLLYDLYPDALVQAGVLPCDSWLTRRCAAITKYAMRECAATVFLGKQLRRYAESAYGAPRCGVVIQVGADGMPFQNTPPLRRNVGDTVEILYAGQMGRMHDAATLIQLLRGGIPAGVVFRFHSNGVRYTHLCEAVVANAQLFLAGALSESDWHTALLKAHVALVTVAPGAEHVVMPSKTYSAMVAGQAILAICPSESDLSDLVLRHDCGWVVEPGDVDGLRAILELIARDPMQLERKRENAYKAGHKEYEMAVIARQWERLFEAIYS